MDQEQPKPEPQEVIQYAEEVDQVLTPRVAVWDLIDDLNATGGFIDLGTGRDDDGPVIHLCRMTSPVLLKPDASALSPARSRPCSCPPDARREFG